MLNDHAHQYSKRREAFDNFTPPRSLTFVTKR
ncbi:MAG: hypothetical protein V7634_2486 [Bradyrhizobium sp.]|jgi:hypothetical protein